MEHPDPSKPSGIKPPSRLPQISSPPRALAELHTSNMNARPAAVTALSKHKPSGRTVFPVLHTVPRRPTDPCPVPEPAAKRKTLAEKAAEPYTRKPVAPPSTRPTSTSVKSTVARKDRAFSASTSTSTSRATAGTLSRTASTSAYGNGSSSMAAGARAPRPKSAYGQYSHTRTKSSNAPPRPATALLKRGVAVVDDDDDERAERQGAHPFLISTNPLDHVRVPKNTHHAQKPRPASLHLPPTGAFLLSTTRSLSSPARPITPVQEEPADSDCDNVCANLEALALRDSRFGRGMASRQEADPSVKSTVLRTQLPRATPTRQLRDQTPMRPPSTPRRTQPKFLNRFTNDRCPDFYDDRMEAMERQFNAFKDKMESDMRQATDQKESIQQLQSRGGLWCRLCTSLATNVMQLLSWRRSALESSPPTGIWRVISRMLRAP
jgi:kinesin family protein C1